MAGIAHVLALLRLVYATVELISDKGGMRLVGYGLVLLALGGYEQASPVELCAVVARAGGARRRRAARAALR